jgi:uncharacterized protein YecE (DUF72 family)
VGPFYPKGTQFDTVEIDATYYRIPSRQMVDGWVEKTPENFLISAKFPRSIVHGGEKATPNRDVILQGDDTLRERDKFLDVIARLGDCCGPLVIQFPYFNKSVFPGKNEFMERLDAFLGDLPDKFRYGVEIRNRAWLSKNYADMLRKHKVALVLIDQAWMPHADEVAEKFDPVTTEFCYIRLIGDRKEIEKITKTWEKEVLFQMDRLTRWTEFLLKLTERQIPTLVYINNHFAGHAPATLRRLKEMLAKAKG